MIEQWKNIDGTMNKYSVSNLGRVKNNITNKVLKNIKGKNGYYFVSLVENGNERKHHYVHRLVAKTFIENENNYLCVNHKDECKGNNNVNNLEWCSHGYNNKYSNITSRPPKEICSYTLEGKLIEKYCSAMEASRQTGISQGCISRVARGERKSTHGIVWRYAE